MEAKAAGITVLCCASLFAIAFGAKAQSAPGVSSTATGNWLVFDAASIKPDNPHGPGPHVSIIRTQAGGRFTAINVSLGQLIGAAYELKPSENQFISLPPWAESQHFDVEAAANASSTPQQVHLMEQALLQDRFELVVHREIRQIPAFKLVQVKSGRLGAQIQPHSDSAECVSFNPSGPLPPPPDPEAIPPPPPPCGGFMGGRTRLAGNRVTMAMLATDLGGILRRPVVDDTGVSGVFDLTLRYTPQLETGPNPPDQQASDMSQFPPIFTALEEQLGLRLEETTDPINALIVDHVEPLSPN